MLFLPSEKKHQKDEIASQVCQKFHISLKTNFLGTDPERDFKM